MGGKRKNMPKAKRRTLTGRGSVGKTAVVGAKDRATKRVKAKVVQKGFVRIPTRPRCKVLSLIRPHRVRKSTLTNTLHTKACRSRTNQSSTAQVNTCATWRIRTEWNHSGA